MTEEQQRQALALAAYLADATQAEPDAVTIGLTDAEFILRALRAYAASLAVR